MTAHVGGAGAGVRGPGPGGPGDARQGGGGAGDGHHPAHPGLGEGRVICTFLVTLISYFYFCRLVKGLEPTIPLEATTTHDIWLEY